MKYLFIPIVVLFIFGCKDGKPNDNDLIEGEYELLQNEPKKEQSFSVKVTENGTSNYGYQILQNGKMIIDQKTIQAIPGNMGFSSKENARSAGEFVLSKIQNGFFPPTVSPEELDSLGVL